MAKAMVPKMREKGAMVVASALEGGLWSFISLSKWLVKTLFRLKRGP